ncbi:hypothetical protein OS493_024217 [Desmophyllum pertusum]|uniref:Homeobox domain-containing protein n=1 Tax=Desmophyllum pertusum TaxID=174260 RepID=A0A9X0CW70_9CNID|nr:hypothetical protein OS493_024217 [Desmophyllum pertusum]
MAQNLPFSIANILRSDFPHPSRITRAPRVLYVAPLRESRKVVPFVALRCQLDRRLSHCNETGFFGRGSYSVATLPAIPAKDVYQNSGHTKELQRKRDNSTASASKKIEETKRASDATAANKSAVKKKRNRSHFTQMQLKYLEDVFSRQQYLTRDERALLANALDMTELQIRNWFQNRRYQLRHRGVNRARQVPVKVLVSSSTSHPSEDR